MSIGTRGRNSRIVVRWQDPTMTWWVCRVIKRPRMACIDDLMRDDRIHIEIAMALVAEEESQN
jgi:hypothetical protein